MTEEEPLLGTLHAVEGEGIVRMRARFATGIEDLWDAVTNPARLRHWYGEVTGDLTQGGEVTVAIPLAGLRLGRVESCEPPRHLVMTMRDPEARPGQPKQTGIDAELVADGHGTSLTWEERGLPIELLPAYGTGIQVHVEHLADYLAGRQLRDDEARWQALLPAYEALDVPE